MSDLISRQAAIDICANAIDLWHGQLGEGALVAVRDMISELPSAQPEQQWNRLMMHLADLQLTYSPNWGADGQGDQKLYDFVTGLIEELEGWEDKPPTEPEQRWIPCGKCIHADGKHRWCKVLDRTINEDYFCCWAEPFREEGETDG